MGWGVLRERLGLRGVVGEEWWDDEGEGEEWWGDEGDDKD